MRTHTEMGKFCTVVYTLVILWCCTLGANGDTNTNSAQSACATSDLFKIISGTQNTRKINPFSPILPVYVSADAININVSINYWDSNTEEIKHKTHKAPIKKIRSDYTLTEGIGYHKFHKTKRNWNDARKSCIAENAQLAVINSAKEENLLRQLIKVNTEADREYQAFIGVHELFHKADWVTVTGEPLRRTGHDVWARGEPNSYLGTDEDCATLDKNRGMNDESCYYQYYYICEIPL
ncbi:hemolymph lipopolysaccharide-binding protein [Cephus cinctus]|uniref:Hemolymph lipopolysaccharide-binding protein n=1 Tax=Cephus cinctus TaxID=211228 RepID=A0AAJ7BX75_CEPCN|nr:hemolymph lipopolysaccharide-binding protein [Cephus cinctus]